MAKQDWYCEEFERTGWKKPSTMEKACKVCPLRNEKGDCLKDIAGDLGSKFGAVYSAQASAIWRAFYSRKPGGD